MDAATVKLKRPSVARIQAEADLLKKIPSRVWIGMGDSYGFWQTVEAENVSSYCAHCWHLGHEEQFCHIKHPELRRSVNTVNITAEVSRMKKIYVPKEKNATAGKDSGQMQAGTDNTVMNVEDKSQQLGETGDNLQRSSSDNKQEQIPVLLVAEDTRQIRHTEGRDNENPDQGLKEVVNKQSADGQPVQVLVSPEDASIRNELVFCQETAEDAVLDSRLSDESAM